MRWMAFALCATLALGLTLTTRSLPATAQSADIDSGGIGLTRAAWEQLHGPGEPVKVVSPYVEQLYAYEGGRYHVAFEGAKPGGEADALVLFVEVAWDSPVPFEEARDAALALLPVDAEMVGSPFVGHATPGGPLDFEILRYVSESFRAVQAAQPASGGTTFNPDVLVAFQGTTTRTSNGHQNVDERTVSLVSLMTSIPISG